MALATLTLQSVVDLTRTHVELLPLSGVGGFSNEPALSLCIDTLQELLCYPLDWKFNRAEMNVFMTAPNRQDYLFAGAVAFTLAGSVRGVGIKLSTDNGVVRSGTTVTVTTLQPHGFAAGETVYMLGNADSNFNSTLTQDGLTSTYSGGWTILTTATTTTFTFTHAVSGSVTTGASGITDMGWLAEGTLASVSSNQAIFPTTHIQAVRMIQPASTVSTPTRVCILNDLGTGVLSIRLLPVPGAGSIFGVNLVYQKKAPLLTALSNFWTPFPDEYSYVYRQMFLARCYRYINSPRSEVEAAKAQAAIMKALGQADREQSDRGLFPEEALATSLDTFGLL